MSIWRLGLSLGHLHAFKEWCTGSQGTSSRGRQRALAPWHAAKVCLGTILQCFVSFHNERVAMLWTQRFVSPTCFTLRRMRCHLQVVKVAMADPSVGRYQCRFGGWDCHLAISTHLKNDARGHKVRAVEVARGLLLPGMPRRFRSRCDLTMFCFVWLCTCCNVVSLKA